MSSDNSSRTQPPAQRFAGPGFHTTMLCIACGHRRPLLGAGVRLYAGSRQRVCANCKTPKAKR